MSVIGTMRLLFQGSGPVAAPLCLYVSYWNYAVVVPRQFSCCSSSLFVCQLLELCSCCSKAVLLLQFLFVCMSVIVTMWLLFQGSSPFAVPLCLYVSYWNYAVESCHSLFLFFRCLGRLCFMIVAITSFIFIQIFSVENKFTVNVLKFRTLFHPFRPKFCFLCSCFLKYLLEWQIV